MDLYLEEHGWRITCTQTELAKAIEALAAGKNSEDYFHMWLISRTERGAPNLADRDVTTDGGSSNQARHLPFQQGNLGPNPSPPTHASTRCRYDHRTERQAPWSPLRRAPRRFYALCASYLPRPLMSDDVAERHIPATTWHRNHKAR